MNHQVTCSKDAGAPITLVGIQAKRFLDAFATEKRCMGDFGQPQVGDVVLGVKITGLPA